MASPEETELEQKLQALKQQEAALLHQEQQQRLTEERITAHQKAVAETERANQLKAQDLIKREQSTEQERRAFTQERQSFFEAQKLLADKRQKRTRLIIPFLLLTCVIAGYLAFTQFGEQSKQYEQITLASDNIDKLARILSFTQEEMLNNASDLIDKKTQLEKTKNMLSDLSNTSEQLQTEIRQLRSNRATSEVEKTALSVSVKMLSTQLANLNTQLEDNYLTNDINEAFIDYQERDLNNFKDQLTAQINAIQKTELSIVKQQNQVHRLEKELALKESQLQIANKKADLLSASLSETKNQYLQLQSQYASLEKQTRAPKSQP
jgi:DNA repair exonuclease SbcCD ATPase subunit